MDINESYQCDTCGSTGSVSHDCKQVSFCPICGELVDSHVNDPRDDDHLI